MDDQTWNVVSKEAVSSLEISLRKAKKKAAAAVILYREARRLEHDLRLELFKVQRLHKDAERKATEQLEDQMLTLQLEGRKIKDIAKDLGVKVGQVNTGLAYARLRQYWRDA